MAGPGDILLGMLDRPAERLSMKSLVLLVHGMTGCENSVYIFNTARHLLDCGYPRVAPQCARRGSVASVLQRASIIVGRTADFRRVLALLQGADEERDHGHRLFVGRRHAAQISGRGGRVLAVARGCQRLRADRPVGTCVQMMRPRNRFYHAYILNGVKAETLGEVRGSHRQRARSFVKLQSGRSMTSRFISPRYGYRRGRRLL